MRGGGFGNFRPCIQTPGPEWICSVFTGEECFSGKDRLPLHHAAQSGSARVVQTSALAKAA